MKINPIIRQVVGRCHVGDSDLRVIRYVISRLRHRYTTFKAMPRRNRRALLQQSIAAHRENHALYRAVMGGAR